MKHIQMLQTDPRADHEIAERYGVSMPEVLKLRKTTEYAGLVLNYRIGDLINAFGFDKVADRVKYITMRMREMRGGEKK